MTRRFLAVATAVLLVASCSRGAPTETTEQATTVAVATTTTIPEPGATTTLPATTTVPAATTASTTTVPVATAVVASLRYTPSRDGFSFENFGEIGRASCRERV